MHIGAQQRRYSPMRLVGVLGMVAASALAGGSVWWFASRSTADYKSAIAPIAMFGPLLAIVGVLSFLALLGAVFNRFGWFQGGGPDAAPRTPIVDEEWEPPHRPRL